MSTVLDNRKRPPPPRPPEQPHQMMSKERKKRVSEPSDKYKVVDTYVRTSFMGHQMPHCAVNEVGVVLLHIIYSVEIL